MATPNILLNVTANEKAAFQALRKLAAGIKGVDKEAEKLNKETKAATKAHKQLERQATRTYDRSKSGAQKYRDQVRMLNQAKKAGILTERQHAQAVRHTKQQFIAAGDAGRRAFGPRALSSIRSITGALGLVGGVAGAVQLARSEWESYIEVMQRA